MASETSSTDPSFADFVQMLGVALAQAVANGAIKSPTGVNFGYPPPAGSWQEAVQKSGLQGLVSWLAADDQRAKIASGVQSGTQPQTPPPPSLGDGVRHVVDVLEAAIKTTKAPEATPGQQADAQATLQAGQKTLEAFNKYLQSLMPKPAAPPPVFPDTPADQIVTSIRTGELRPAQPQPNPLPPPGEPPKQSATRKPSDSPPATPARPPSPLDGIAKAGNTFLGLLKEWVKPPESAHKKRPKKEESESDADPQDSSTGDSDATAESSESDEVVIADVGPAMGRGVYERMRDGGDTDIAPTPPDPIPEGPPDITADFDKA